MVVTTSRTVSNNTPQITATIPISTPGRYRVRVVYLMGDNGVTGQADVVFSVRVNGAIPTNGSDFITNQSVSYNTFYIYEREFDYTTGTVQLEVFRNTGTKSVIISGPRQVYIERVG